MSLKDDLLKQAPRAKAGMYSKGKCAVREWLVTQDEQMIKEFMEVLETDTSTMSLYRFLTSTVPNIDFGLTIFRIHRNHWCSCL
jgi:hypothetical protein